MTGMLTKPVRMPMIMTMAPPTHIPAHITRNEAALLETDAELVGSVYLKPSIDRDTQMPRHKKVEAEDDQKLKLDRKGKVQLLDD